MEKIGLRGWLLLGMLLVAIVSIFYLAMVFQQIIVNRTSKWIGFLFFLYSISIMVICWRYDSGKLTTKDFCLFQISFGLLAVMSAIMPEMFKFMFWTLAFFATLGMFKAVIIATMLPKTKIGIIFDTFVSIVGCFSSIFAILLTDAMIAGQKMTLVCSSIFIVIQVLIIFFFKAISQLEAEATRRKEKPAEG